MEKSQYSHANLNELLNFSYNFDLLKGIIETLLKNQQNLQKQVESMEKENKEFQLLKYELKTAKEELQNLNEKFKLMFDNSNDEKFNGDDKRNSIIEDDDFGFGKVKTIDQLKKKLIQFRKEYEKERLDLEKQREHLNLISSRFFKIFGENENEENPTPLNDKLNDIDKKLKFLLGDTTLEDIENQDQNNEGKSDGEKKKVMSFQEMNRKIAKLEFIKVDTAAFDLKADKMMNNSEEIKNRLNDLIFNLYGYNGDLYEFDPNIKFLIVDEFEKYKIKIGKELERIWTEIMKLKEMINELLEKSKNKCSVNDIERNNDYIFSKLDEVFDDLDKKYVLKNENTNALKNLEEQFKRIILLLATKVDHENDNWLIAKKPINGYSCAACESFIGDLKEEKNDKYINWKKMPMREREKEKEQEKEKIYRLGNGYSHVLKMVGVDNNKNVSLNPNSNKDMKILFPGNFENNKMKEGVDLQIRKTTFSDRVKSAHSKESKKKAIDVIRSKNFEKKLPKIKGSMSSDDFDKIIENPNPSLNLKENVISPKIIKIMKKTHSKFNV